ncbi:lysylphosphatidylglycerol synthase domain-containing protein [Streptomyces sp. NPDC056352]|uniref:lysylphosphatidylglycerol synthase domain-containing protein n=1 Tax=Streptomyces sp. NPDC056352 TaxID=3345791 RepID=UPI0035D736CA
MTTPSDAPVISGRRASWHTAATLLVLLVAAVLAARHWTVIDTGTQELAAADRGWLLVAATAAALTWGCAALAQQGTVTEPLPAGRLVAAQFAAAAANHVLPAGVGAGAVNWRFLTRCGLTPTDTATALALKATASATSRAALITGLSVACPGILHLPHLPAGIPAMLLVSAAAAIALLSRLLRTWIRDRLQTALAQVRAVHELPARAAALWGGSLAFAASHALVVYAVTQALDIPLPAARVALAYLAASSAAVLLPTPGGIGSLDAALALALVTAGIPGGAAATVVLGYRLLTVWLPLVPGLLVLALLVRRKVL